MNDSEFSTYLDYCYEQLENKQASFMNHYGISNFEEYWYDQDKSLLQFKNNGIVQLSFDVIFVGSWSGLSNTWMWCWANTSMSDEVRVRSSKIRESAAVTGQKMFSEEVFESDEYLAHELAAFAVEHFNSMGIYISPGEKSKLFMAIMNPII